MVAVAPSFADVERPEQTFEVGASTVLECKADGVPEPTVGWYKNEDPVSDVRLSETSKNEKGVENRFGVRWERQRANRSADTSSSC